MFAALSFALMGCASVHQEDLDPWQGVPVATLETHPIFVTMPMVRTMASDGTEIRMYVNGANVSACGGGGGVRIAPQQQRGRFSGMLDTASYTAYSNCVQKFAACRAIFYIKGDRIDHVTLIGTGGARCYTNESVRPGFKGSTNIQ
jgi:hypothetical protein